MKLVPIKYDTATPSLGRGSIAAATAEGRGAARVAGAVQDLAVQVAQKHRRMQVENSTAELDLELSEWKKKHNGKEYYDSTEVSNLEGVRLTEDIVDEKGETQTVPRHNIPAWEVQSQLYERYASNLIKSKAGGIEWTVDKNLWESRMNAVLNEKTAQNKLRDLGMREKYNTERAMQNFDNALRANNFEAAIGIINAADIPEQKRSEMRLTVYETQERSALDNTLIENERLALEMGLAAMADEEGYDDAGGKLADSERLGYVRSFRAALNALDAKSASALAADVAKINRKAQQMVDAIKTPYGHSISPSTVQTMIEELQAIGPKGAAKLEKLILAHSMMVTSQKYKLGSPLQRDAFLKDTEDEYSKIENPSPMQILHMDAWRNTHEEATIAQNKDPLQFSIDTGRVDTAPLPTNAAGKVNFSDSDWAESRLLDRDAATEHNGGLKTGLLTKSETATVIAQMEEASPSEKVVFITGAVNSLGVDGSRDLFTQISMEKESGAWAHVGTIAAQSPQAAKNVLRGKELREEHKGIVKNITQDYLPEIVGQIGGTTAYFNSNTRASVQTSILDAYAYLADRDSKWEEGYDEERMIEAVTMATGGMLMEHNGLVIQRPDRDVNADDFEDWIDEVDPIYISQLGGVDGYQDENVIEYLRDGRLILISHGPNEYSMRDTETGQFLMSPGTDAPFTFMYNKDAPRLETRQFRAGRRAGR